MGVSASLIYSISVGLSASTVSSYILCRELQRQIDYKTGQAEIYKELYDGSMKIFIRGYE